MGVGGKVGSIWWEVSFEWMCARSITLL